MIGQSLLLLVFTRGVAAASDTSDSDDDNFREDVIKCEVAAAHIEACCPGVTAPKTACVYHYLYTSRDCGCESGSTYHEERTTPVLGVAASDAILASTCEQIAANDGCSTYAATLAKPNATSSDGGQCESDSL